MEDATEEVIKKASEILKKHGIETYLIIVKCPDNDKFFSRNAGSMPYLVSVTHEVLRYLKQFFRIQPPNNQLGGKF